MAALQLKNLPTGPGDDLKVDASYAKGDTKNVISAEATSPSFAMFGGSNRAYQSVGFGQTSDGVYAPVGLALGGGGAAGVGGSGDIKLVESYGVRGAFNHNWDPYWSSSLFGSGRRVREKIPKRPRPVAIQTGADMIRCPLIVTRKIRLIGNVAIVRSLAKTDAVKALYGILPRSHLESCPPRYRAVIQHGRACGRF